MAQLKPLTSTLFLPSKDALDLSRKIHEIQERFDANFVTEEVFDDEHKIEITEKYGPVFGKVKAVIISLEGTLYQYSMSFEQLVPTKGALEAFKKLRRSGLKILLVSSTWLIPKVKLVALLNKLGFKVEDKEVFTSSDCCKMFIQKFSVEFPFLLVADDVLQDFPEFEKLHLQSDVKFDSVILGLPSTMIDYRLLTNTLTILGRGSPLLVLNPEKNERVAGNCKIAGPGMFAKYLEFATGCNVFVPSKPSTGFYKEACQLLCCEPEECVVIGDSISGDVLDPHSIGMKTILVKTGQYKSRDEERFCGISPDLTVNDFHKAVMYILSASGNDPDFAAELLREQIRAERRMGVEKGDFMKRLGAYATTDCTVTRRKACMKQVGSFSSLWRMHDNFE